MTVEMFAAVVSCISLLVSLFVYGDSHRSKLKPLLLIEGMMDWDKMTYEKDKDGDLQGIPINIRAVKNMPLDIEGHLVKDGFSYQLIFANHIAKKEGEKDVWNYTPNWRWLPEGGMVFAMYNPESPTTKPARGIENQIHISYRDIEDNRYSLNVNAEYVQKIKRGS